MTDLELVLAVEHRGKTKDDLSLLLDLEIERFSNWMANLSDWRAAGALSRPEKALLKTYLVNKVTGKL